MAFFGSETDGMERVKVCVLLNEELTRNMLVPRVTEALDSFADWRHVLLDRPLETGELGALLAEDDAVLISWRSPFFAPEIKTWAGRLRFIGYAAGSVKPVVSPELMRAGVTVSSASAVMAPYVAEMALAMTLALLRKLPENQREMKEFRSWKARPAVDAESLFGARVGLIGFGVTAREFAKLLAPFGAEILIHDPYLTEIEASSRGARLVSLEELLASCRVVSLHAPDVPATRGLIGRAQLAAMQDGAVFINTARGRLVDEDALRAELESGRIRAGLDVYAAEPLSPESPLRDLGDNVLLTTHVGGPVYNRRWEMALAMAEEMRAFFAGEPLRYQVRPESLDIMA